MSAVALQIDFPSDAGFSENVVASLCALGKSRIPEQVTQVVKPNTSIGAALEHSIQISWRRLIREYLTAF